jgi:hypothetical protein
VSTAIPANAGIAPTLLETPWSPRPEDRVGHFGCSAGGGRLVRLGLRGQKGRKPPKALIVACPACEQPHRVEPIWRRPSPRDPDAEPELIVDAATVESDGTAGEDEDDASGAVI